MRFCRTLCCATKWSGLILALCLAALWAWSGTHRAAYLTSGGWAVAIGRGMLGAGHVGTPGPASVLPGYSLDQSSGPMLWWFDLGRGKAGTMIGIPLWFLAVVSLAASAFAWHLDTRTARRALLNQCPHCRYTRAGLAPAAVCPECGTAPPAG